MLLLQLHSGFGVTPRHQIIKTCQEHFEKLLHVLWQPLDCVRICKRSFKLEAKWRQGHTVALTWVTSFSDHIQRPGAPHTSWERAEKSEEPYFLFMFIFGKSFLQPPPSLPYFLSILCPLFFHLPGRDNLMPTESRNGAEGIFEWELWLQTFHLMLYLAKTGCRVPWLSEGIHQRWDQTRGEEAIWNVMSVTEKSGGNLPH